MHGHGRSKVDAYAKRCISNHSNGCKPEGYRIQERTIERRERARGKEEVEEGLEEYDDLEDEQ